MQRHVLINCIEWNRAARDHAWRDRHSTNRQMALDACRNAQRFANNIDRLEIQLAQLENGQ